MARGGAAGLLLRRRGYILTWSRRASIRGSFACGVGYRDEGLGSRVECLRTWLWWLGVRVLHALTGRWTHAIGLGSGVRNLYKYAKAYGGADPIFVEGNEFVTSVGLKKGLFDSEKVMIGPGKEPIDPEKGSFGDEKVSIGRKIGSIDRMIDSLDVSTPTRAHLKELRSTIAEMQSFGRVEIMRLIEIESAQAGRLLNLMLKNRMVEPVKGQGKGRYRWVRD